MQEAAETANDSRRLGRSVGAVIAGLVIIFVTHNGFDQIMHATGIFPPLGEPMDDPALYALALGYRIVFAIVGCYVTAWLAPRKPMQHALVLGGIGVVLSTLGAIAMWGFGPSWYPVTLILISLPCAWAGGELYVRYARR